MSYIMLPANWDWTNAPYLSNYNYEKRYAQDAYHTYLGTSYDSNGLIYAAKLELRNLRSIPGYTSGSFNRLVVKIVFDNVNKNATLNRPGYTKGFLSSYNKTTSGMDNNIRYSIIDQSYLYSDANKINRLTPDRNYSQGGNVTDITTRTCYLIFDHLSNFNTSKGYLDTLYVYLNPYLYDNVDQNSNPAAGSISSNTNVFLRWTNTKFDSSNSAKGGCEIYFTNTTTYSLSLNIDDGVSSVTGAGSYFSGTYANTNIKIKDGYVIDFIDGTSEDGTTTKIWTDSRGKSSESLQWLMNSNRTINIHTVKKSFSIVYDSNGFNIDKLPLSQTKYFDQNITIANTPIITCGNRKIVFEAQKGKFDNIYTTKTYIPDVNCTNTKWTENSDGSGSAYYSGNTYSKNSRNNTEKLYLQSQILYYYVDAPTPERAGYEFIGWSTNSSAKPTDDDIVKDRIRITPYDFTSNYKFYYAVYKAKGLATINIGGKHKKATIWIYKNNKWKQYTPYFMKNNKWKISG